MPLQGPEFTEANKDAGIELAGKLSELIVDQNIGVLEAAVKYLPENVRTSLLRAIEMSGIKLEEGN